MTEQTTAVLEPTTLALRDDPRLVLKCEPFGDRDFTHYVLANDFRDRLKNCVKHDNDKRRVETGRSFDLEPGLTLDTTDTRGRLHAALCCCGNYFSVTFRSLTHETKQFTEPDFKPWAAPLEAACPNDNVLEEPDSKHDGFLASFKDVGGLLFRTIFQDSSKPFEAGHGLVLLAGATGTGKTSYLNALLYFYLRAVLSGCAEQYAKAEEVARKRADTASKEPLSVRPPRRPHVLAIGDPVETVLYRPNKNDTMADLGARIARMEQRPLDFTPRILGIDVSSVRAALTDALRETPSVVVVSELRNDDDFRATLDFAATGHLVFATSHNSSLVDAMQKLMGVAKAETPSGRAGLVQRLRAVVHVQPLPSVREGAVTLPAVWRSNTSALRNFVCEGPSSILHRAPLDQVEQAGTLGYRWAARELTNRSSWSPESKAAIDRAALRFDLNLR